jgi:hypothetical protein
MDVRIKAALEFTVSGTSLEDAMADDGPNTLEEYDQLQQEQTG